MEKESLEIPNSEIDYSGHSEKKLDTRVDLAVKSAQNLPQPTSIFKPSTKKKSKIVFEHITPTLPENDS